MLVANDVQRDPRVLKEARSLVRAGYQVGVVGLAHGRDRGWELVPHGFRMRLVAAESPPRALLRSLLERHAKPALPLVRAAYRRLKRARAAPSSTAPALERRQSQHADMLAGLALHRGRMLRMTKAALAMRPRVVHAHDLDTLEAAAWIARATGAALVFDAHEIYWQQHAAGEAPPEWIAFYRQLEARLIGRADAVITVCDSIADFFASTHGIRRPHVVRNAIELPAQAIMPHASQAPVDVLFHGGYARDRGLEELITAAASFENARLVLRGFGPLESELSNLVDSRGLSSRVRFAPPVPMSEVVEAASSADIGVIPYKPVCLNNRYSTPNKLFEYLHAGVAIAASDLPEIRRVVSGEDVGLLFDPSDPLSIARAVNKLAANPERLTDMRRRAITAARARHHWGIEESTLLEIYQRLLPRPLGARLRRIGLGMAS